jgi:hypothetical protein
VPYNIKINAIRKADTLCYKIYGEASGNITALEDCKYCYLLDNHYVFADTLLFSIRSLSIDSVCKTINKKLYQEYKRRNIPIPPSVIWDCKTLKIL